jgi:hypothetical protein
VSASGGGEVESGKPPPVLCMRDACDAKLVLDLVSYYLMTWTSTNSQSCS